MVHLHLLLEISEDIIAVIFECKCSLKCTVVPEPAFYILYFHS